MTQARTLNGQVIGQAERATRALLDGLLAETGTSFNSWVCLNVVATQGEMRPDALVHQLVDGLRIAEPQARLAIDEAISAGRMTVDGVVVLTSAGDGAYQRIRDGIDALTRRLYDDLAHDDLVIARRVLETITDRARRELVRA